MNNNLEKRIKQIETENYIWIIYLGIIGLSYYANYYEKKYFLTKDNNYKNIYRKTNAFVFIILVLIYSYFENDSINSMFEKNKSKTKQKYDNLTLIATTLVLISGIIFLYIILDDNNLDSEIAFN